MSPVTTDGAELTRLATALQAAHADRVPIEPLSLVVPGLSIPDAYGIQQRLVKSWTDAGRRVVGRKIGLTSAAMQRQLGVDQPDFGVIVDDMLIEDGATVDRARFIAPRVEPELAFIIDRELRGAYVRPVDVLGAVRYVAPSLEIIDSRIADWRIGISDTIADNASSGAVVVGTPVEVSQLRLRGMGCVLRGDGEIRATGAGGAVLGSPLLAIAWLVRTLAGFGEGLRAGDLVIPGSVTPAQPTTTTDRWTADFEGAGRVRVEFEGAAA